MDPTEETQLLILKELKRIRRLLNYPYKNVALEVNLDDD